MDNPRRMLNQHDVDRIRGFLTLATESGASRFRSLLELKKDAASALVLDPPSIPPDVVTMNTEVRFDAAAPTGSSIVKVVFPQEANFGEGKVSILAPLGAALLGRRRGDTVTYTAPGGEVQIEITEIIYQPESSGDYES